jgi:hypothetical protein
MRATAAIGDVALFDVQPGIAHRARRVLEQQQALSRSHYPEQVAQLLPVIIVDAMIEVRRFAREQHRQLGDDQPIHPHEAREIRIRLRGPCHISDSDATAGSDLLDEQPRRKRFLVNESLIFRVRPLRRLSAAAPWRRNNCRRHRARRQDRPGVGKIVDTSGTVKPRQRSTASVLAP